MAAVTPPWAIQASSHPATAPRQSAQGKLGSPVGAFAGGVQPTTGGGGHGACGAGDFVVTQNGTPNMTVNVAQGLGAIRGTESQHQGVYGPCYNDATVNLAIATSDPTNPRNDLVVAKVRDAQYSGASNDFSLAVVTGTPNAVPADPTPPANCIVIARVRVDAAVASIVTAKITDLRPRASALNAVIICTSTTRPTGSALYEGLRIYELDTDKEYFYNGSSFRQRLAGGSFSGSTTAGGVVTIAHGLGYTPAWAVVTPQGTSSPDQINKPNVTAVDGTNITVTVYRTDGAGPLVSNPFVCYWLAGM